MPSNEGRNCSESSDESFINLNFVCLEDQRNDFPRKSSSNNRPSLLLTIVLTVVLAVAIAACVLLGLILSGRFTWLNAPAGDASGAGGSQDCTTPCQHAADLNSSAPRHGPLYINLAIDDSAIAVCAKKFSPTMRLPCKRKREIITGSSDAASLKHSGETIDYPLGPLKCIDDAFDQNGKVRDNCVGNRFKLALNDTGVTIPESGVYHVHSTISFVDSVDYYVGSIIRIDPADCMADAACLHSRQARNRRAHTWLSCASHHAVKDGNKFTACILDGVRHFDRGDVISFSVTQEFRSINPYYKTTQFYIYKL